MPSSAPASFLFLSVCYNCVRQHYSCVCDYLDYLRQIIQTFYKLNLGETSQNGSWATKQEYFSEEFASKIENDYGLCMVYKCTEAGINSRLTVPSKVCAPQVSTKSLEKMIWPSIIVRRLE